MKKLSLGILVALTTTVLSGCALYFGNDHEDGDSWTYCGTDGYYVCDGDDCEWAGSSCPDPGSGSGGGMGGGFECTDSADCAAGCYCANGTCEEAGFCTQDSDCGRGYVCNEERSSCEPGGATCTNDASCPSGNICLEGQCTSTCVCSTDAEAASQGYDYCDESRVTCMSGDDPAGTCAGEGTCGTRPTCAAGDVPLIGADGCWNGQCEAAGQCADAPACGHINDEPTCTGRGDCHTLVNGINCTKPDGPDPDTLPDACQAGDMNCTCEQLLFAGCAAN